jgi:hypothetical protein
MISGHDEELLIRGYLLGRLTTEERDAVGRRLLEDAEFFDQVQDEEDHLIDAAARRELDSADAASLAEMLRVSSQEHRLAFAEALTRAAGARRRAAAWRYAAVAAGVLLACGSAWLAWDNYRLRARLAVVVPPPREQQVAAVYPLFLPATVTRGPGTARSVRIPGSAEIVELQLDLGAASPGPYWVVLRTAPGETVATQRAERPAADAPLRVPVSAALLQPGSYEVEVSTESGGARRPVQFYYFKKE